MTTINKFLIAAGATLAQLQLALGDQSLGGGKVTAYEWVGVGIAAIAAAGVYAVPYAAGKIRP